jgi:hypothetical protein
MSWSGNRPSSGRAYKIAAAQNVRYGTKRTPAAEELEIAAVGAAARLRFLGAGELECENQRPRQAH